MITDLPAYLSFDVVPAPKGASTHIAAFVGAVAGAFGQVDLVTVAAGDRVVECERWPGVRHVELPALGPSLIDRVLCFRRYLAPVLEGVIRKNELVQFRSIFEGLPLPGMRDRPRLVFEVNGLPSIELKYRYPGVEDDRELMAKIRAQEGVCLRAADRVVTPSGVTAGYLVNARGIPADRVVVVPNGVDTELFRPGSRASDGVLRLLYFGTLTSWQGTELAIRALAWVRSRIPAKLTIVGSGGRGERDGLAALAEKLGVGGDVAVEPAVSQEELAGYLRASDAVVAPLEWNDRNAVQGCCPLKVLEGMAAGLPVIASDLAAVRELGRDGVELLLVKPGSVDAIAGAAMRVWNEPEMAAAMGRAARARVVDRFTWARAGSALLDVYADLGVRPSNKD